MAYQLCYCVLFNDPATTEIYTYGHTRSLHDARPIVVAEHALDAHGLGEVAGRGRGAVGVDVADVRWIDAGVTDRVAHAARAALAVLAGLGHVERVAAHAETCVPGVVALPPRLSSLVFLLLPVSAPFPHYPPLPFSSPF